jgi:hypothetical protein
MVAVEAWGCPAMHERAAPSTAPTAACAAPVDGRSDTPPLALNSAGRIPVGRARFAGRDGFAACSSSSTTLSGFARAGASCCVAAPRSLASDGAAAARLAGSRRGGELLGGDGDGLRCRLRSLLAGSMSGVTAGVRVRAASSAATVAGGAGARATSRPGAARSASGADRSSTSRTRRQDRPPPRRRQSTGRACRTTGCDARRHGAPIALRLDRRRDRCGDGSTARVLATRSRATPSRG